MAPIDEVTAAIDWIFQKPAPTRTSTKAENLQKNQAKPAKAAAKPAPGTKAEAEDASRL